MLGRRGEGQQTVLAEAGAGERADAGDPGGAFGEGARLVQGDGVDPAQTFHDDGGLGEDAVAAGVRHGREERGIVDSTTAQGEATIMKVIARSRAGCNAEPNASGTAKTARVAATMPIE